MTLVPLIVAAVLFLVAIALGFHCLLLHCDSTKKVEPARESDSASRRARPR